MVQRKTMTMMINLMRTKRKKKSIGRNLMPSKWLKKETLAVQSGDNYNPYYLIWAAGEVSELPGKIKDDYAHLCSGFTLVGGSIIKKSTITKDPPLHQKWLSPSTFLPPKCWFYNFHAVFGHFTQNVCLHQSTTNGKTWHFERDKKQQK